MKHLIFMSCFLICSCALDLCNDRTVEVNLPSSADGEWRKWQVVWNEGSEIKSRFLHSGKHEITVQQDGITAVLARPEGGLLFKKVNVPMQPVPACSESLGMLYPFDESLNKDSAFACDVFITLMKESSSPGKEVYTFLEHFNWRQFIDECRKTENVWNLDRQKILKAIASGSFSRRLFTVQAQP